MTNERAQRIVDSPGAAAPPETEHPGAGLADAELTEAGLPASEAAADAFDATAEAPNLATAELDAGSAFADPGAAPAADVDEEQETSEAALHDVDDGNEDQAEVIAEDEPAAPGDLAADDEAQDDELPVSDTPDDDTAVTAEYESLPRVLEALLFVADEPIAPAALGRALELTPAQVRRGLDELAETLRDETRGVRLQQGPDGAQLVTAPDVATTVEHFLGLEANRRLSNAALETLAIVAYRQPVTRHVIEQIRGVNSDGAIATLRARGLIEGIGRAPGPGRPLLFSSTQRFLEHFGLERPDELPPLPDDVGLPVEAQGAQLALEAAVAGELEATEDADDESSQLAFDDGPDASKDGDSDAPEEDAIAETVASNVVEDDPELEISDDLDELSRAASMALGGPSEGSDDRLDE